MRFRTGRHANSHGGQRRPAGSPSEPTVPWLVVAAWVTVLLAEAALDAVDLPGPQRERERVGRTGQRAQIALASAACSSDLPVHESGKNRPGSAGRQAASCHHLPPAISRATSARYGDSRAAASSRRLGQGYALRAPQPARKGRAWPRCGRLCTRTSVSRCGRPGRSAQALSPARAEAQSRAMAKAGRNQRVHGCPRTTGSAVLRSRESPGSGDAF
jgi:hypothetical protein